MMFTAEFWKATAERMIRTFAQAWVAVLTVAATTGGGFDSVNWSAVTQASLLAALLALVTCVVAAPLGAPGPAVTGETLTTKVAAVETPPQDHEAEFRAGPAAHVEEDTPVTVEQAWVDTRPEVPAEPLDAPNEDYDPLQYGGDSKVDGTYHGKHEGNPPA